ncbi:MAG TPA: EamA family transporter, partial [Acidobacteriaceae bacterium]
LLGIAMLIGFFASYLTALSWADLTYVLPTTSIGNVVLALLSKFWLHEDISPARWVGIVLITIGVGFVANGESYTRTARDEPGKDTMGALGARAAKEPGL